jgi:predicted nucleic acid-binding protein
MAISIRRIYWDSCTWIALIQREIITLPDGKVEDRGAMCRSIINAAFAGECEIATSTLAFVEVCKSPKLENPKTSKVADFFEHEFIIPVSVDHEVSMMARKLMLSGFSKLKPMDACHVAAAAMSGAGEMNTFDDKLLALDDKIDRPDGTKLKICKPGQSGPLPPLLQLVAKG